MSRTTKIAVLIISGVFAITALTITVVLAIGVTGRNEAVAVTRDDVLTHWAKMPLAEPATPADVDRNADAVCARIRQDSSASFIIGNAEQLDRANGGGDLFREQMRLMVAYRCPEYATLFQK